MEDVDAVLESVYRNAVRLLTAAPGMTRMSVRSGDVCIEVERDAAAVVPVGASPAATPAGEVAASSGAYVRAELVGTFYRAPGPGQTPFVGVGDVVEEGQQVGILEAMKLMNPVHANASGLVAEFLAEDGQPVEFDQPLLMLAGVGEER